MTDAHQLAEKLTDARGKPGQNATLGVKGFVRIPIAQRFWSKVAVKGPDDCWLWTGARSRAGYGYIWDGEKKKTRHASQVSIELHTGKPMPPGMVALHRCDNPPCVNPAHLWAGTLRENIIDAINKGRFDMRKVWAVNHNRGRTHCRNGHEFSGKNLGIHPTGRYCKQCRNDRLARVRAKRKCA